MVPVRAEVGTTAAVVAHDPAEDVTPPVSAGIAPQGSAVALVSVRDDGVPRAGVVNVGDVVIATLPDPDMVYSPSTPALSNKIRVVVPPPITVVPTVIPDDAAVTVHVDPSVHV